MAAVRALEGTFFATVRGKVASPRSTTTDDLGCLRLPRRIVWSKGGYRPRFQDLEMAAGSAQSAQPRPYMG